ncbi:uncharacterized protein LOC108111845 [Drosophila eugracilis]|uniref:uncharacterized protein LOC108111845 n=1 Tax=Drosophila eugracilis TaxID=29029 RepID=UPI0007E5F495|nr:uncharacterized protein LOC108111845 [Drosophila eugracilis]
MESINSVTYIILLISLIIGGCKGIPYRPQSYMDNQQFCMDTMTGRQLYVGEIFTREGQCIRVQCLESSRLWEDSCQVPKLTKGDCKRVPPKDDNPEYPRCCPLYECKSYETNPEGTMEMTNTYDHYGTLRLSSLTELIVIDKRPRSHGEIPTAPARKYQV